MVRYYSVNGELVPAELASVKVNDLALIRGYGAFDYFLLTDGKPVFVDDYLTRFFNSARLLDLEINFSKESFKQHLFDLIRKNGVKNAGIRLLVTGGYSENGYTPDQPNVLIMMYEMTPASSYGALSHAKLMLYPFQREMPEIKSINYVTGIWLRKRLKEVGALEPLYHRGDIVTESVRSNVFLVDHNDRIFTPKEDILLGITRQHLILSGKDHFHIEEKTITLQDLNDAREVFLTSSTKGVLPITQIDDKIFNNGVPGEVTIALGNHFQAYRQKYLENCEPVVL